MLLCLAAAVISRRWLRSGAAMMLALCVGVLLGWRGYHPPMPEEGKYTVTGVVAQEVVWEPGKKVQTVLTDVTLNGLSQPDAYWTYYLDEEEEAPTWLKPGEWVELTARVYHPHGQMNPGGFNFKEYLLQRGVRFGLYGRECLARAEGGFSLRGWVADIRHELSLRLMEVMGREAGAYAAAMLLGTRDFIPMDERAAFSDLGIAHILSVSGYHVGVLAMLLLLLLRPMPLGRAGRMAVEAAVMAAYCLLTGGNAPVIRAALLLLWREYTRLRHRQILPLHMLCVTAVVQLIFNPTQLNSASFQLTYGAMLGLLLVCPWLVRQRVCKTVPGQRLWELFTATLAAQLGVLFPQLYWFGELPLLSLLLNMLIMPLAGLWITLYWITLAALPIPGLRELLGGLSGVVTQGLLAAVRWLAALPVTTLWTAQANALTFAGWALMIFTGSALLPRRLVLHRRKLLLLGAVTIALLLVPAPERSVTYTQLSVGNADAAVLQDRDVTVVIDTGEDGQAVASYLHRKRQAVEMLIITHLHSDHGGGIRALLDEEIPVEVCYLPVDATPPIIDEDVLPLLEELARKGTEFRDLRRGDTVTLPSGTLTALWPLQDRVTLRHDANDVCLVLQAEIAGVTMLLTGDLPGTYAGHVAVPSDVLKVAHHGSWSAVSAEFLEAVKPKLMLLSNENEHRELYTETLAGETPLYTTQKHGGIILRFQGEGRFTVDSVVK